MKGSLSIAPPFLISACFGGDWSAPRPGRFTPGQRAAGTPWMGGRMGPRGGLDTMEKIKSFLCRESNPGRPACASSLYRLSCGRKTAREHINIKMKCKRLFFRGLFPNTARKESHTLICPLSYKTSVNTYQTTRRHIPENKSSSGIFVLYIFFFPLSV
jgi:hypothetical protein